MADIRIKCWHGYPEDIEIKINNWLEDTGHKIEEINICASHGSKGQSISNIQVFCMLRYKI